MSQREFSSTQVDLPEHIARQVRAAGMEIPDSELAEDGREGNVHATVKYGLHINHPERVRRLLADEKPIKLKLRRTSIFPAKEASVRGGDQFDVVKIDVHSPDLHRINKKIADALPHTDSHPVYHPHVTLAYVKAGKGKKYDGYKIPGATGREIVISQVIFSDKSGKHHKITLGVPAKAH